MKRLILLRHAKSRWSDPALDDFDRPLNKRGKKAAPHVAALLRGAGLVPEIVLCSAAARAVETWELVRPTLPPGTEVRIQRQLYLAPPSVMRRALSTLGGNFECAMILAHNPGLQSFALQLAADGKPAAMKQLRAKYPTAAAAVIDLDCKTWAEDPRGKGYLSALILPGKR